jgi:3-hydroxyisobutyrate dehydrogenase-like beta-hydroxyacid dehydrogenase
MDPSLARVGFLGFGEAGYHMAKGLVGAGLAGIVAYDKYAADPKAGDLIRRRAAEAGIALVPSIRRLCRDANLIIALVPGRAALRAVRAAAPHLTPGHIYVDAGTASVTAMEEAGRVLEGKAGFVDAAMMGAVPLSGHKVAILASGSHAEAFRAAMQSHGMNIRVVGDRPGAATAMKLIRSVFMKGLAAVTIEALEAARRHGVLEKTVQGLAEYMDEYPFGTHIRRFVGGTAVNAERRVFEMGEVLAFLKALGSTDTMTRATRKGLQRVAALALRERFGGAEPSDMAAVLDALVAEPPAGGAEEED